MFPFVDEINLAGSLHFAFFGLLIPFAVVRGRMKLRQNCYGLNDKQTRVYLVKTLTRVKCGEACKATKMVTCQWEGSK